MLDALLLTRRRIDQKLFTGLGFSGVDAEIGQTSRACLSDWILNASAAKGSLSSAFRVITFSESAAFRSAFEADLLFDFFVFAETVAPTIERNVGRRWKVGDHSVEQRLDALVLEGTAAEDRHHIRGKASLRRMAVAQRIDQKFRSPSRIIAPSPHRRSRPSRFDQLISSRVRRHPSSPLGIAPSMRNSAPWDSRHPSKVLAVSSKSTTPKNVSSAPIGSCKGSGRAPSRSSIIETTFSKFAPIRSILFTKAMRGTLIFIRLSPNRFRLRFDPTHATKDGYHSVQEPGATVRLRW